ncbi:MAG: cupredoxin domain-containing protein [bacterium]
MKGVVVLVVVLATVAVALAGPAAPRTILIKAREFVFEPKEVTARTGEVTFDIKNEGAIEHNFVIEDAAQKKVAQIAVIEAGKTEDLKIILRAGTYALICNLPGHKDAGMTGTLRVQP